MTGTDVKVILDNMKSRRAARSFTGEPVSDDDIWQMVQAGRFAASGGNLRPHRFLVTRNPETVRKIRSFSPGMLAEPSAIIAILIDWDQVAREFSSIQPSMIPYVDVGTAAQNMLNMAYALGVGSCPVTSFSQSGVAGVLDLPSNLTVELLIMLGQPKPVERGLNANAPKSVTTKDLTSWETFGNHDR
ncbi:MAG: nitroreductase family protein [Thermomicrobiales bacterium]|nr:nitroreductase family protein [Thermomicrobiales bacterium]